MSLQYKLVSSRDDVQGVKFVKMHGSTEKKPIAIVRSGIQFERTAEDGSVDSPKISMMPRLPNLQYAKEH